MNMQKLKPHDLVIVDHGDYSHCGECISYPTPDDTIMVRLVPGDSSTMVELPLSKVGNVNCKYKWVHYAKVRGKFGFPVDMLRYDFAAPVNFTIGDDGKATLKEGETEFIVAKCTETKSGGAWNAWTEARWASFSWTLERLKTLKLERVS